MKTLALIALISLAACSRAEWQENPGDRQQAQEQGKGQPSAPTPAPFPEPEKFADCKSQTLNVTVDTSKAQTPLQDFKTVLTRYPQMRVTKAAKTKAKSVFYLNARDANKRACTDEACAESAGWSQIQDDIHSLNDVQLSCEGEV